MGFRRRELNKKMMQEGEQFLDGPDPESNQRVKGLKPRLRGSVQKIDYAIALFLAVVVAALVVGFTIHFHVKL